MPIRKRPAPIPRGKPKLKQGILPIFGPSAELKAARNRVYADFDWRNWEETFKRDRELTDAERAKGNTNGKARK